MSREPSAVTIRLFQPRDQDQIEWLQKRTPAAGQVAWREATVPDDLRRISRSYSAFWVALEMLQDQSGASDAIVGMAGMTRVSAVAIGPPIPDFLDTPPGTARLHRMRVAPERWRRGIGRKLARAALDWARKEKFESVILETTPQQEAAVSLYRSLGFAEKGRSALGSYELVWFQLML
jgi:ribosomal protein S18 acetylase RimI-like enzyme